MNEDTDQFVSDLCAWLDRPQTHLDDASRRKTIEEMVNKHHAEIRRLAEKKALRIEVLFYVGIVGTAFTLILNFSKVLELF